MHYFEYTPEKDQQPARLELVADQQSEADEKILRLVIRAINVFERDQISKKDIRTVLESEQNCLPISIYSKLISAENVVDTSTGLLVDMSKGGTPIQLTHTEEARRESLAYYSKKLGRQELSLLHSKECPTITYAAQIIKTPGEETQIIEHETYGHIGNEGAFMPVVTLISDGHPALRAA